MKSILFSSPEHFFLSFQLNRLSLIISFPIIMLTFLQESIIVMIQILNVVLIFPIDIFKMWLWRFRLRMGWFFDLLYCKHRFNWFFSNHISKRISIINILLLWIFFILTQCYMLCLLLSVTILVARCPERVYGCFTWVNICFWITLIHFF